MILLDGILKRQIKNKFYFFSKNLINKKVCKLLLKVASTVVERLLHRSKVEGLSPVANAGSGRKKNG